MPCGSFNLEKQNAIDGEYHVSETIETSNVLMWKARRRDDAIRNCPGDEGGHRLWFSVQ
jgi:hypothetical protein